MAQESSCFCAAQVAPIQRKISRVWRMYFSKVQRGRGRILVRVVYEAQLSGEAPYITGSFTESKWTRLLPLPYSLSSRCYAREVWMSITDMFQIFDGSRIVVLPEFLTSQYHVANGEACMLPARSPNHYQKLLRFHARKTRKVPLLTFQAASSLIPKSGHFPEDSHFLDSSLLGVSDGVGGWRSLGIDSGRFACELMAACKAQSLPLWSLVLSPAEDDSSEDCPTVPYSFLVPVASTALEAVESPGSATILLCAIHSGLLELFNLGDSQAMLLRYSEGERRVVLRTRSMQHAFNCPYQVSKPLSETEKAELLQVCPQSQAKALARALRNSKMISDGVSSGDVYTVRVRDGDLLVVGTDGLWDNLYEDEILKEISMELPAEEIARRLTKAAYMKSRSKNKTPFEDEAVAMYGEQAWKGGKEDDITVLAAWIRSLPL